MPAAAPSHIARGSPAFSSFALRLTKTRLPWSRAVIMTPRSPIWMATGVVKWSTFG